MELCLHALLSLYLIRAIPNTLSDRCHSMSAQSRSPEEHRFAFRLIRLQRQ